MNIVFATITIVAFCMILFAIPVFVFKRKDIPVGKCSSVPGTNKLSCEMVSKKKN